MQEQADFIYQEALSDHPEWWEVEYDDQDDRCEAIFDQIIEEYLVEDGSELADLIWENVDAGLT